MIENNTQINAVTIPTDVSSLSDAELMKLTGQLDPVNSLVTPSLIAIQIDLQVSRANKAHALLGAII